MPDTTNSLRLNKVEEKIASEKLRILYISLNVLGDSGANAAELFPLYAGQSLDISQVTVADFGKNELYIRDHQKVDFLELRRRPRIISAIRNAIRIIRYVRIQNIDIIHSFYRNKNIVLFVIIGTLLKIVAPRTRLIVDHRSVNLAIGYRGLIKKLLNTMLLPFVDHFSGNPLAVESNYFFSVKRRSIIDLGYDALPTSMGDINCESHNIWYIGSLKPKNRKTEFLIDIIRSVDSTLAGDKPFRFHIAGQATAEQQRILESIPSVTYYGRIPRNELYALMAKYPGTGIAYMNREHHDLAPSLKFSEYAGLGFNILASNTRGQTLQAQRMGLGNVRFPPETKEAWVNALTDYIQTNPKPDYVWSTKDDWSYQNIFNNQAIPLYKSLTQKEGQ